MIVIGIDPGQTGGLAKLTEVSGPYVFPMPTVAAPKGSGHVLDLGSLIQILEAWTSPATTAHVFIERAHAMPKQGVTSMFNYGMGFGQILGILAAIPLKYSLVEARTWTKAMHEGTPAGDTKARSLIACQRLFPGVKLTAGRGTKPHKGIVDALLIASYGRRQLGG